MKTTPKDFFLHLLATIVLYISAGALINLAFSVINYFKPDQLAGYFTSSSVATPISMLIVLIPILYVLEWLIARDARIAPEKQEIWIQKWRVYLTLFLAGAAIIGDIIALVNTYLNGEITSRLVYKVLAVLIIAGIVFAFYIVKKVQVRKVLAVAGIVVALATIVGGFLTVGSPTKQRGLRFDSQRVSDLSSIQWQIINHWQQKGKLPATLTDLNNSIGGYIVPSDPNTSASYGYSVVTGTTSVAFQLCAEFSLPSQDTKGRGAYGGGYGGFGGVAYRDVATSYPYPGSNNDVWSHGAGKACFDRTIDPDMYPVTPKPR